MKSLQERLHQLEAAGLINRKDYGTLPKKVEFSLTEHGRRLMEIMADIKKLSDDIHQQNGNCRCPFELSRGQAGLQNAGFDCPVRFDKD